MKLLRSALLLPLLFIYISADVYSAPRTTHPESETTALNDLIKTMLSPYVTQELSRYYEKTLKYPPVYAPYFGTRINVKRTEPGKFEFIVTVHADPYLGPHISVGEDDITFKINVIGEVQTLNYKHVKDYKLPPHMWNYYK
jgi:hypothetical protein